MKQIFFLAIPFALMGQESSPPPPSNLREINRSALVIEAKARAEDILKAYDTLKREKPTLKISARTFSGQILSNIVEISAMPNGTLILFRLSSTQGVKSLFISVDDVLDLFYS